MDKLGSGQPTRSTLRKDKKKKAKGEIDRVKQAEKKKRRLEKALATSAAIRSELEKKKQKEIEEQQRLDEEGAAIAESVALLVLRGDDSDCYDHTILNCSDGFNIVGDPPNSELQMNCPCLKVYSFNNLGQVSSGYRSGPRCNDSAIGWSPPADISQIYQQRHYSKDSSYGPHLLAGIVPSRPTSAIEIAKDIHGDMMYGKRTAQYLLDTMIGGGYVRNEGYGRCIADFDRVLPGGDKYASIAQPAVAK